MGEKWGRMAWRYAPHHIWIEGMRLRVVQDCFHQPLGHLMAYEHLARAAHRVHAHEAWCARGHSLHLALQALTVCVCVLSAPSFAARLITDVFVDKNGDGRNDADKEMVCG